MADLVEKISSISHELSHPSELPVSELGAVPAVAQNLVIGAGLSGLVYARALAEQDGTTSVILLERASTVGGVWSLYANTTSRVNTAEPAYRIMDRNVAHIDHTPTAMIMRDVASIVESLPGQIRLQVETLSV